PPLEPVNPVDRVLPTFERKNRGEEYAAEPLGGHLGGERVCRTHDVLQLVVVDDDPVVAVLVALALDLRAGLLGDRVDELVDVVERAPEVDRRLWLERDRPGAGRREPELRIERHRGGGQREETIFARLLELLLAEEDVPETQGLGDGAAHLARDLGERGDALL